MSIKTSRPAPARSPEPSTGPRATGDHALRVRQDGGTYHGIAAVGLVPATVPGRLSSPLPPPRLRPPTALETRHRTRRRPRYPRARAPAEREGRVAAHERLTGDFTLEVPDVREGRGSRRSDNEHAGQAIGLIRDVTRI